MANAIDLEAAAFDIYEYAIGRFADLGIDAAMVHLVMASVMVRIDGFALANFAAQARENERAAIAARRAAEELAQAGGDADAA
ncbi:hypothetical protein [Adlercreutzia mucosicola]|uniref:hypothetical protein n=1 Tax=Adlercreutzia mucosicola TaxID=580026 RepID=UPI000415763A|nr:hypothetical protein [Adlercreutzia mucosicola]MCR2034159.1 hypothetical protein [Adlercreutzia mucosicola]